MAADENGRTAEESAMVGVRMDVTEDRWVSWDNPEAAEKTKVR
ncbi:hypothetical protein [Teichococcus vastitatis]|nr:hypothetical protein [Pseudoroseomonas vastitatis]